MASRALSRSPSGTSKLLTGIFHSGQHGSWTNWISTYPIKDDFLRAAESQDIPFVDDLEDLSTGHGAEHWLKWINRDTGRRSDSAHGYIHSTRAVHQNLHLLTSNKVDKVCNHLP